MPLPGAIEPLHIRRRAITYGLDIGVVSPIKYLGRPDKEIYDFVQHLNLYAEYGDGWNVSSGMNTIVEYTRESMATQLEEYVQDSELAQEAIDKIRSWVDGLPWSGDGIVLHFSW